MILITTYYMSLNEERNKEIQKCLIKNFENQYIKKIYLLNNQIYDLSFIKKSNKKIEQVIISNNNNYILNYKDAIDYINTNLQNNICILSNSDIYFDNSLFNINSYNIAGKFYALLRYDEDEKGERHIFRRHNEPRDDSQDSWIFKSPLNIDTNKLDFTFRTLGCDSILAKHVYDTGIKVCNPSYDIITTYDK